MTCSRMHTTPTPTRFPLLPLLLLAAAAFPCSRAVLYGDEIYQDVPGGRFWAFYTGGIAVIDPETCSIESTIEEDHSGDPLPNAFNDGVYMQSRDNSEGYILIGSRVDETNAMGDAISHMYAISTTQRKVISKGEVGPRVVHSYGLYPQGEFWMHSDGNGLFYVFDIDDLRNTSHDDIEAKVEKPSHGKLLWDEGAKLKDRGFATSTSEQYLFEIDLKTKKQVSAYDYSGFDDIEGCRGLHAIAYSELNEHVYAECSGGGGALEFDVSDGRIRFVQQFPEANGALYETPDGRYVVASSKGMDALFVFVPQGTGNKSTQEYTIRMDGHPSTVSFYTNAENDVIACSPLTENLNQNQRRNDGSVACGYYEGCTGAKSSTDVAAGVCAHGDDALTLMSVARETSDSIPNVCLRCEDSDNYETTEDGSLRCTCTPHCGSCDPNPKYNDDDSGYMCVNLSKYVEAESTGGKPVEATLIPNTGGMHQGSPYGSSPACTFGRTYRNHKRGMHYDASVSNIPNHSIVIIDMERYQKKCSVALPAHPSKVLYAPDKPVAVNAASTVSGSSSLAVSRTASVAAVMTIGAVLASVL